MYQRINITLPKETIRLIDRIAPRGQRSTMIDRAIRHFIRSVGRERLRKQLREGATVRAERDVSISGEWFALGEDE